MSGRVAFFHVERSGGSRREMYEFARQFAVHDFQIKTYTTSLSDDWRFSMTDFGEELVRKVEQPHYWRIPGITGFFKVRADLEFLRRVEAAEKELAETMDEEGFKFVFAHHSRPVQSPYIFKYLKKTPSVYFCAEPMRRFYEPAPQRPQKEKPLLQRVIDSRYYLANRRYWAQVQADDRRNISTARLVVTNSNYTARYLRQVYGVAARACHLGVDTEKFKPLTNRKPREQLFLSVGAVAPLKGYDLLIRAISMLPEDIRWPLVIVGNSRGSRETRFLTQLAGELGVVLVIREDIPDQELVDLYQKSQLVLYAAVREPMGFVPLEAMACATPVVAVREGGPSETVADGVTGLLSSRDPRAFRDCIVKALEPKVWRQLGGNCVSYIRQYWTWEHAFQRLGAILSAANLPLA